MHGGDILLSINKSFLYFGTMENLLTRAYFVWARREEIHLMFPL